MRVAVVGPGAIGATFGAVAEAAGHDVVLCGRRAAPAPVVERPDGAEHALAAASRATRPPRTGRSRGCCSPSRPTRPPARRTGWPLCAPRDDRGRAPERVEHRALVEPLAGDGDRRPERRLVPVRDHRPGPGQPARRRRAHGRRRCRGRRARRAARARRRSGRPRCRLPGRGVAQAHGQCRRRPHGDNPPARRGLPPRRCRRPRAGLRARMCRGRPGRGRRAADGEAEAVLERLAGMPGDLGTSIMFDRLAGRPMEWDARNGVVRRLGPARDPDAGQRRPRPAARGARRGARRRSARRVLVAPADPVVPVGLVAALRRAVEQRGRRCR